jgi:hypothetical protein
MRIIAIVILTAVVCIAFGQTKSEKFLRAFSFDVPGKHNLLQVQNLNGNVSVQGYDGEQVVVEVERIVSAKTADGFEKGWRDVQLGVIDDGDTIVLYVKGICLQFNKNKWRDDRTFQWGYDGTNCTDAENFDYRFNFTIKVPRAVNISVGTVNDGKVTVTSMASSVKANNVNGDIEVSSMTCPVKAVTVNGDVDVDYLSNPISDASFYTLNGNINAIFKTSLSSRIKFKSQNGSFFTNVSSLEELPPTAERIAEEKGVKYRIEDNYYKAGEGGALLRFETFNGNVYVKEQ